MPPPDDTEVARVTTRIARRILALLERRGLGPQADPDEADSLRRDEPLLAELYGASVHGRIATGPRAGRRVSTVGDGIDVENLAVPAGPRCSSASGVSVHANVCVPARDRQRLEDLQPDCDDVGPDRLAHGDDHARRACVVLRRAL